LEEEKPFVIGRGYISTDEQDFINNLKKIIFTNIKESMTDEEKKKINSDMERLKEKKDHTGLYEYMGKISRKWINKNDNNKWVTDLLNEITGFVLRRNYTKSIYFDMIMSRMRFQNRLSLQFNEHTQVIADQVIKELSSCGIVLVNDVPEFIETKTRPNGKSVKIFEYVIKKIPALET